MPNNHHIDLAGLQDIIVGRVNPKIYAFSTETIPNYLKVGDTYRSIKVRLDEWRKYFPHLIQRFEDKAVINDVFFRDFSVHKYLENIQKERLQRDSIDSETYYSKEFFKDANEKDLEDAIDDIKEDYRHNKGIYKFYKFEDSVIPVTYTYIRDKRLSQDPINKRPSKSLNKL